MKRVALTVLIATLCLSVLPAQAEPERRALTFGVVPQQSASRLAAMWAPFLAHLGAQTGLSIEFRTTKDIPTFEACLAEGAFDLAYMNPYHYAVFAADPGYRALARQKAKRLQGLLVVRRDSPIQTLDALQGQTVAFPSPAAFGASVLPRAEMRSRGIGITPSYVRSHDSVYRAVAAGIMPAGGGVIRTFNAAEPALRDQLRVVYETERYTPHAIAAAPGVPGQMREAVLDALLRAETEAPELLAAVGFPGLEAARDADWDDVRALSLTPEHTGIGTMEELTCPSG